MLAPILYKLLTEKIGPIHSFVDLFAGTGSVASAFNQPNIEVIVNDILQFNYICLSTFFETTDPTHLKEATHWIDILNNLDPYEAEWRDDYVVDNFGGTYFSMSDALRIGTIRNTIAHLDLPWAITRILITSLIYAVDKIANTCGHYDTYIKGGMKPGPGLFLRLPIVDVKNNLNNRAYRRDANELCGHLDCDVLFLDPPYNSRQYASSYHLLENLAVWGKPLTKGKAAKPVVEGFKSAYSTRQAATALNSLLDSAHAKWLVLTYNNMGDKGHPRSNVRIHDDALLPMLSSWGRMEVVTIPHRLYTAGRGSYSDNAERVFLIHRI